MSVKKYVDYDNAAYIWEKSKNKFVSKETGKGLSESNYTQTAKEMLLSGDWVSPRIFGNFWYDKPAFFYWELIAAFKVFGFTDFAARFFPAKTRLAARLSVGLAKNTLSLRHGSPASVTAMPTPLARFRDVGAGSGLEKYHILFAPREITWRARMYPAAVLSMPTRS